MYELNRRQAVGTALKVLGGVAATVAAAAPAPAAEPEGKARPLQTTKREYQVAEGYLQLYGEGTAPYFVLDKMPEGVAHFVIDGSSRFNNLAQLALTAAQNTWNVTVFYTKGTGTSASVFELRAVVPQRWRAAPRSSEPGKKEEMESWCYEP